MDGRRVARVLRAVRVHKRWRQIDVAKSARVSQSTVSRAERGLLDRVSPIQLDQIAAVLDVSIFLDAKWNGGIVDRLIDRAHASIVEAVVRELRDLGWEVVVEFGFNHYGDRGSVDVLAWHSATRTLLIVEVKSILTDLQSTFTRIATKVRVVPMLARRDLGWDVQSVSRLIVLPGSTANRATVARHEATFDVVLPDRMPAIRSWLRRPNGSIAGLWLLSSMPSGIATNVIRVRRGLPRRRRRSPVHAARRSRATSGDLHA
jgi:transcriptional regulator with XRE-family HTH domain